MGVSHKYKLCFVHIPKTAGVSIQEALGMEERHHKPASHWAEKYPDYKLFTVHRNEEDRLKSVYRYIKDPPMGSASFEAFKLQIKHGDEWLDDVIDYELRYETLQTDFDKMLKDLGHKPIKLPHLNKSK